MTLEEAKDACGMCVACKEWTTVAESCCGAGVEYEGHIYFDDDLEEDGAVQ